MVGQQKGTCDVHIRVDLETDALYFRVAEAPIEASEEVSPGVIVDYNGNGRRMGVEVLEITERFRKRDLSQLKVDILSLAA